MEIYINKEKLSFELENEKSLYDIVSALGEFYGKETPQLFITQIIVDGKEFSYADERLLHSTELSNIDRMDFEFRDIIGVSTLSIAQIRLYLDVLHKEVLKNCWDDTFVNAIESFTWMLDGVNQIVDIFGVDKFGLGIMRDMFVSSYKKLEVLFLNLKAEIFPLEQICVNDISVIIEELKSILDKISQGIVSISSNNEQDLIRDLPLLTKEFVELLPVLSEVSNSLQRGNDNSAMIVIQKLTALIDTAISLFSYCKSTNPDFVDELSVGGRTFESFFVDLTTNLNELLEAIENKDSIMIGDIVEYEFYPNIEYLIEILQYINSTWCEKK